MVGSLKLEMTVNTYHRVVWLDLPHCALRHRRDFPPVGFALCQLFSRPLDGTFAQVNGENESRGYLPPAYYLRPRRRYNANLEEAAGPLHVGECPATLSLTTYRKTATPIGTGTEIINMIT